MPRSFAEAAEVALSRIQMTERGCWLFTGPRNRSGYGYLKADGKNRMAHRVVYAVEVGHLPDELTIEHDCHTQDQSCPGGICDHRACINPAHLRAVTLAENVAVNVRARQTRCINGHAYTEENTYRRRNGNRDCRACRARQWRASNAKRDAARAALRRHPELDAFNSANAHQAKLTWEKVADLRARYRAGETIRELAEAYGVAYPTVYSVVHGRTWPVERCPLPAVVLGGVA